MPLLDWSLLALVTLVAAAAQGATGFGFAILAISFYLAILNSVAAVQIAITGSLVISLVLAPRLWRAAPRGLLLRLCAGTLVGFPLGLWAYLHASLEAVKLAVACLIIVFSGYLLFFRPRNRQDGGEGGWGPLADLGVGFVSGAMATGLGMPGPSVLLYLQASGADKTETRATTLALFTFSYIGALTLQAGVIGMTGEIWLVALVLAPVAAIGAFGGHGVARWIDEQTFRRAVLMILIAAGAYTLWTSLGA
ncbi:MAG: sulfite exporter TauE/SafE family protein [Alphaproteobacteria bacterium]|jgi:uncharacterized membrane protein YfcA|nr:sulfite exporter TauE/SafE family protein [Alphaproteobacteria bacterium]